FTSTLSHVMRAAAAARLPVIVLDRPNPLGGVEVEGPILEPAHASFVGLHPIPIRHGATMGELGRLWASFGVGVEPLVVRCAGCQLHVTDADAFRPVAAGAAILAALRHGYPEQFAWRENAGRFSVDRLAGTSALREAIDAGRSWREIAAGWTQGIDAYRPQL